MYNIYICMRACVTLPVVFHVSLDVGLGQGDGTDGEPIKNATVRINASGVRWCLGSIVVASDWDPGMFTE